MRFVFFTHMTPAECSKVLHERIQTSRRPELDGWIDKNGAFSLAVSSKVAHTFPRTTRLHGKMERDKGVTAINGYVSTGLAPRDRALIAIGMALAGFFLIASGNGLPGIIAIFTGPIFLIPLAGDYSNSETLLNEIRRTLRARETVPPKPAPKKPGATVATGSNRPAAKPTYSSTQAARSSKAPSTRRPASTSTRKPTSSTSRSSPRR